MAYLTSSLFIILQYTSLLAAAAWHMPPGNATQPSARPMPLLPPGNATQPSARPMPLLPPATQPSDIAPHPHLTCLPWMALDNGSCKCNISNPKTVRCEDKELCILACYCLSYYEELDRFVVGNCLYTCTLKHWYRTIVDRVNINSESLNPTCTNFSRRGKMCSQCENGTGYPLYSYSMHCVKCDNSFASVVKYIAAAFLPLTVFYVVVLTFRISATAENLSGYIMMTQLLTTPSQLRYMTALHADHKGTVAINVAIALQAVWNLDFFKSLYKPFCYQESTYALTVVSLDYIIALYPLGLILLTFIFVHVHDRFLVVARLWKPMHRLFSCLRRQWHVRRSLVDAFTTFLLLSYIKILNASFDILLPTTLHDVSTNDVISKEYLYYDASQRIFHYGHIKYAILATVMTLVFNVTPLLLLICYPCKLFQRLLNCCGPSRFHQLLHVFMDAFQGCYRTSPLDCRYFAGLGLLVRVANLLIFSLTLSRYYYMFSCMLLVVMAGLVIIVKPYKSSRQNTIDAAMFLVSAFGYISATAYALSPDSTYNKILIYLMGLAILIMLGYVAVLLLYNMVVKSPLLRIVAYLWNSLCRRSKSNENRDEELFESHRERDEIRPLFVRSSR